MSFTLCYVNERLVFFPGKGTRYLLSYSSEFEHMYNAGGLADGSAGVAGERLHIR